MRYFFLPVLAMLCIGTMTGQNAVCDCEAVIDYNHRGVVPILGSPSGKVLKQLKRPRGEDNYFKLHIRKDSAEHFLVTVKNALTGKTSASGWIRKNSYIGTYARNYEAGDTLKLFAGPSSQSAVESVVPDWNNQLYTIESCNGKWVRVRMGRKVGKYFGWLAPEMQCANPFTTCN